MLGVQLCSLCGSLQHLSSDQIWCDDDFHRVGECEGQVDFLFLQWRCFLCISSGLMRLAAAYDFNGLFIDWEFVPDSVRFLESDGIWEERIMLFLSILMEFGCETFSSSARRAEMLGKFALFSYKLMSSAWFVGFCVKCVTFEFDWAFRPWFPAAFSALFAGPTGAGGRYQRCKPFIA